MAAYANLLSLESTINQILNRDRFSISPDEKGLIFSLQKYALSLQAFLEEIPQKAKILEARIRDVADDAEDIIQLFLEDQIHCRCIYTERIGTPTGIMFESQLQKVIHEMNSIADELLVIQNSTAIEDVQHGDSVGVNSSSQAVEAGKSKMVGFDEDLIEIKDKLCGEAKELQVLPIHGMGGIGKTTLARNAYDDKFIVEYFEVRAWVTVSQDYSDRRILSELLNSLKEFHPKWRKEAMAENSGKCNNKMEEISKLREEVRKMLRGKTFLIVMDDIWSTNVLDDVKHLFPNENNGSRIMLTTREKKVADYAYCSLSLHEMGLMNPDQSWNLLRQKVQDSIPQELESIGREIAQQCGGLPLAIVVIAGLLSRVSKTRTSWEEISRNIRPSLVTANGQIIEKVLSLSYNHLPQHLRPCFLFMGTFPEDHEINVTDLIRLWIAESFVKPVVSKEIEIADTAEVYLNDLIDRSLIVVSKRMPNGKIKSCSLHDMVREMCLKLSQEEGFFVRVTSAPELQKSMKDQRRVSICLSIDSLANIYSSTIRTIMYFEGQVSNHERIGFIKELGNFRLLKVLYLVKFYHTGLLFDQCFKLFHLRYVSMNYACSIPKTISRLENLQTLVIGLIKHKHLPYEIWNMQQLRHLNVPNGCLADPNTDTPALENLRTLRVKSLTCSVSVLNLIPNLTELSLFATYEFQELLFHNLLRLNRLEKLHFELRFWGTLKPGSELIVVAPSSLKELVLFDWRSTIPKIEIVGPFPTLEVLELRNFNFEEEVWKTTGEEFPQLKYLLIQNSNLRQWETESSHFPRLEALHICACPFLSKIPDFTGISTLNLIKLETCVPCLVNSVKEMQEDLRGCDDNPFEVRFIDCEPIEKLFEFLQGIQSQDYEIQIQI